MSQNKGILPVTGVALGALAGPFVGWGLALLIIGIVLLLCARTFRRRSIEAPVYESYDFADHGRDHYTYIDADSVDGGYSDAQAFFMHEER